MRCSRIIHDSQTFCIPFYSHTLLDHRQKCTKRTLFLLTHTTTIYYTYTTLLTRISTALMVRSATMHINNLRIRRARDHTDRAYACSAEVSLSKPRIAFHIGYIHVCMVYIYVGLCSHCNDVAFSPPCDTYICVRVSAICVMLSVFALLWWRIVRRRSDRSFWTRGGPAEPDLVVVSARAKSLLEWGMHINIIMKPPRARALSMCVCVWDHRRWGGWMMIVAKPDRKHI